MDEHGVLYEMTKAPMGHSAVPEIMHTIVATLAGVEGYAKVITVVNHNHIFIDGLRVSGTRVQVENACKAIDARAVAVGATFKASESMIGKEYVFNGVSFDHAKQVVSVRSRTVAKISLQDGFTNDDAEALVGRLIHASAILGIPLAEKYFTLKCIRRRLAAVNRGALKGSSPCLIPARVLADLKAWVRDVRANVPVQPQRTGPLCPKATIFTDASGDGWGSVFVDNAGMVHIAGSKWSGKSPEINHGELLAVRHAFSAFENLLEDSADIDLRVDNTSVMAAMNKQRSQSEQLSRELVGILKDMRDKKWRVKASYVHTSRNPADSISRPNKRKG